MRIFKWVFVCSFFFTISTSFSQSVIPQPASLKITKGEFTITRKTPLVQGPVWLTGTSALDMYAKFFQNYIGITLNKVAAYREGKFEKAINIKKANDVSLGNEGYKLQVREDGILIYANTDTGFYYAMQTLFQLFPVENFYNPKNKSITLPCCEITDVPRFAYRGMHLDVCRHFFPVSFIKNYIDLLAMHKMNVFHWHLTDDQGWRIEIKKYPRLTEVGSVRKQSMIGKYDDNTFDGKEYKGFYTQDEIREVVKFAQERFVTVIPEIEMPGHSLAALAAYPEYSCVGGALEVGTKWGVFEDVFCPKEETFKFLEDVLSEVISLFPSQYIHVGGDECPKARWKTCAHCQALIKQENLKDEMGLQSYFIRRIEKFLNSKNKKLIGWDEILEGGLAPAATVMSWRGTEGGIAAARMNHDVVMTPGSHCYFDHYQSEPSTEPNAIGGYTTIKKVYDFEPVPTDSLTTEQQKHILGAQANVWTEYILEPAHVEYMAYPRALALAEVLWSPKNVRDWNNFSSRLLNHFQFLDKLKVNYSKSIFDVTTQTISDTINNKIKVKIDKLISGGEIHYTLDGKEPSSKSSLYTEPILIAKNSSVKAKLFANNVAGKTLSRDFVIHKANAFSYSLTNPVKQYDGGTTYALTDGVMGIPNRYNTWIGLWGKDLECIIDFKKPIDVKKITINFYGKNSAWIYLPEYVEVFTSDDGINFTSLGKENITEVFSKNEIHISTFATSQTKRYIKVFAKSRGKIPEGQEGAGNDVWLFADEIIVE